MEIVCPKCNATYAIAEDKVPAVKAAVLTCKRCGHRIAIKLGPRASEPPPAPAEQRTTTVPAAPAVAGGSQPVDIVKRYPEAASFPVRQYRLADLLSPNKKGDYKTRMNTTKLKLLATARPLLDRLLAADEQVARIAAATAYYPAELLLGNGWMTMLYNRYILVATNKRVLAINTNYKMTQVTHYLFQFPYTAISKISTGLFGTSLTLTRKGARRRLFTGIKRSMAAGIKAWAASRIDPKLTIKSAEDRCDTLCPACGEPLTPKLQACPVCGSAFKSPRKAALQSLLVPGWGDMYLGHRGLGAIKIVGSLVLWAVVLGMILSRKSDDAVIGVVLLLFVNGMDGLLTLHMAKKGYALEKKQPTDTTTARVQPRAA
jgi:predicted Zn finger-like uncharacterized protein